MPRLPNHRDGDPGRRAGRSAARPEAAPERRPLARRSRDRACIGRFRKRRRSPGPWQTLRSSVRRRPGSRMPPWLRLTRTPDDASGPRPSPSPSPRQRPVVRRRLPRRMSRSRPILEDLKRREGRARSSACCSSASPAGSVPGRPRLARMLGEARRRRVRRRRPRREPRSAPEHARATICVVEALRGRTSSRREATSIAKPSPASSSPTRPRPAGPRGDRASRGAPAVRRDAPTRYRGHGRGRGDERSAPRRDRHAHGLPRC